MSKTSVFLTISNLLEVLTVATSITPRNVPSFSTNLWKANILDIELAFPIVLHFAKKSETVARNIYWNSPFQSFSGFLPDIAKIEELILGIGQCNIQAREEKLAQVCDSYCVPNLTFSG